MANIRTHYDNLRVARNAPDSVIKAAYKALCQTYHPDKFQGSNAEAERIMKLINTSYTVLIDPVKRAEHDAWIRAQEAEVNQPREKATFGETGNGTEQEFYQKQETKWKYTPPPTDPEPPAQKQTSTNWGAWVFGIGTVSFFAFIGFGLKPESMPTTNTAPVTVTSVPAQSVTQPSVTGRSPLDSLLEDSKTPQAVTGSTGCIGDCINGQGTLTYTVGDKYVGQFKNGQPDGQGALIYVSGDKYVGEFKNNTVSGQGVATYVNGDKYEGMLSNGMRKGRGTLTYSNGTKVTGEWENDQLVQATPQDIYQHATDLYNQGRYAEALPLYQGLAEQGNAKAQSSLGYMYSEGKGVAQNDTQAVYWFNKAAEQGDALAQNNLGIMYHNGEGVAQNDTQTVYWHSKAAEQGYAEAQNNLGFMYHNGEGVAQNQNQAVYWYRKAAEQGNAKAQYGLGFMYHNGEGVAQNYNQAAYWYRKAAEQGNAHAIAALKRLVHNAIVSDN